MLVLRAAKTSVLADLNKLDNTDLVATRSCMDWTKKWIYSTLKLKQICSKFRTLNLADICASMQVNATQINRFDSVQFVCKCGVNLIFA